jgi:hypothetical protein
MLSPSATAQHGTASSISIAVTGVAQKRERAVLSGADVYDSLETAFGKGGTSVGANACFCGVIDFLL